MIDKPDSKDALIEGYRKFPSNEELQAMSFVELAEMLASCEYGSTKYIALERERYRRDMELSRKPPQKPE